MERKRVFRSGIVLLELMAAILIFALAGAVCVQVLMKADSLASEARNLSEGIHAVSSAAEILRSAESESQARERIRQAWPQSVLDEAITIELPDGQMVIHGENAEGLWTYQICWQGQAETRYQLELKRMDREVSP